MVYISEAWFPEDEHELLNWICKQRDIIELTETENVSGKKCYVFQFALGDDMVHRYSTFLDEMNLQHNTPIDVPKSFKREIMNNIRAYSQHHAHYITVKSTLPYKEFDHKSSESRGIRKPLQFLEVIAMMEIAFGISNLGGLNKQLLCNPCFIRKKYSYTKDSMKKNSNLPSDKSLEGSGSAQQRVHSNSDSSDGSYEGDGGVTTAESIQSHNNTEHPKHDNNTEQPEQEINKQLMHQKRNGLCLL